MRRYLLSFLVVFGVFVSCTLGGSVFTMAAYAAGREAYAAWDTLSRAYHEVQSRYVEELDAQTLVYAAIEGMVEVLDPHSAFLDPEAYANLQRQEQDRYFGIGVRVSPHEHGLRIVEVLPDSPAHHAEMRVGDIITSIDEHPLAGEAFEQAAERISGPRGELVALELLRLEEQLELVVARDMVHVPAAWSELIQPGLGYVALVHFHEGSGREFESALRELEERNGGPLEQLVLDLRDNPGGLLDEANHVVDLFVGEVDIVSTRGRDDREKETHRGSASPQDLALSPIILVNSGSASASEIVAGALRVHGRATLVGTPTYGKGSVQAIWAFEDESALKLTISRYYLPDGSPIDHREGLQPDHLVHSPEHERLLELIDELERQVQERGDALRSVDRGALLEALAQVETSLPEPAPHRLWQVPVQDRIASDPQLARALELADTTQPRE
jgi:carboxyl-terminal processing protease